MATQAGLHGSSMRHSDRGTATDLREEMHIATTVLHSPGVPVLAESTQT